MVSNEILLVEQVFFYNGSPLPSRLWTYFTTCSSISVVNFEHVIVGRRI